MIDLHTHSTASDGTDSPAGLIDLACTKKLIALALTDHDTCSGLPEAETIAQARGFQFIPGIEIEIIWDKPGIFHLLGLNIVKYRSNLQPLLEDLGRRRLERNLGIIERMQKAGIAVELGEIEDIAGGSSIGRPHFADYLVRNGHVKYQQEAFNRYLRPGRDFYVPYTGIRFQDAVEAIHGAGGKAFVAHPLSLNLKNPEMMSIFEELKSQGLDGLEAWHPSVRFKEAQNLEELAVTLGLGISAGSDYHGSRHPGRILGKTLENRQKIDDRFLTSLFDT